MEKFVPPGDCPVCGEYVEEGSTACKSCGSCPQSGWSEDTAYDGLDLPDDTAVSVGSEKEPLPVKKLVMASLLLIGVIVLFVLTKP